MTSRELQNDPRTLQNGVPKSSRIALQHPVAPRGAAQARYCKPLEREHQFHRPARSTLDSWHHAAPPVVRLVLSPPSLTFSHLLPSTSLPPRRTHGVGGTYWAAPTAADPEKRSATDNDREKPAQIQHINIQTNIEIQKFHVRDTTHFLQDDLGVQNHFDVHENHIRCRQNSPEEPWKVNTRAPNRL